MTNDLISREELIKAVEDLYEYAELDEVLDVIKAAPTVNDCPNEESFSREELKAWLYAIAINNLDGLERDKIFADDCKEIIDRLDGFERFVKDRREGKI